MLGLLIGIIVGLVTSCVAYEHFNYTVYSALDSIDAVKQLGLTTASKEHRPADLQRNEGHDVYFVKGELIYRFGLLFNAFESGVTRAKENSFQMIAQAEKFA